MHLLPNHALALSCAYFAQVYLEEEFFHHTKPDHLSDEDHAHAIFMRAFRAGRAFKDLRK